jgi:hypothetical protein
MIEKRAALRTEKGPEMKTRSKILVMGVTATGVVAIGLAAGAQRLIVKQDTYLATNGGNVGVGTATPGQKLEVLGNISLPSSGGNKQIYTWSPTDGNWRIGMSASPGFTRGLATSHVEYLTFASGAGQGFALGDNVSGLSAFEVTGSGNAYQAYFRGNVGIGTPTPTRTLDLSTNGQITFGNNGYSSTGSPGLFWYSDNVNYGIYKSAGSWTSPNYQQLTLAFSTGVVIDGGSAYGKSGTILQPNGGKVGIGTTTPAYTLHVNGTAAGTSWTNLSSRDYKEDVRYVASSEYDQMLAKVVAMKPARYRYKQAYTDDQSVHLGFIAEEMPRDVLSPNGKGVDTYELVTYLAGAVKAQENRMRTKEAQLEAQLKAQAEEIAQLKALVRGQARR